MRLRKPNVLEWLVALFVVLVLALLFVPPIPSSRVRETARKAQAKVHVAGLVTAMRYFQADYGRYRKPPADGKFVTLEQNAELLRVLRGMNDEENPRGIIYFEVPDAKVRNGKLSNGIDPKTGALLDPWGNFYRVAVDADGSGGIENPYDDAGPKKLKLPVIVWSLGKDGRQGKRGAVRTFTGSDDILSWQP
jgi:type II secretory pathway pseudopilin PulG